MVWQDQQWVRVSGGTRSAEVSGVAGSVVGWGQWCGRVSGGLGSVVEQGQLRSMVWQGQQWVGVSGVAGSAVGWGQW